MTSLFLINILLMLAWGAVTGSFSEVNLAFGFVLSFGALYLIREQVGTAAYFQRVSKGFGLAGRLPAGFATLSFESLDVSVSSRDSIRRCCWTSAAFPS